MDWIRQETGSASIRALVILLVMGLIVLAASQLITQYIQLQERRIQQLEEQVFLLNIGSRIEELVNQDGFLDILDWERGNPLSGEIEIDGLQVPQRMAGTIGQIVSARVSFFDLHAVLNLNAIPERWVNSLWFGTLLKPGVSFKEFDDFRRENGYPEEVQAFAHLLSEDWMDLVGTVSVLNPNFTDPGYLEYVLRTRTGNEDLEVPILDGRFVREEEEERYWADLGVSDLRIQPVVSFDRAFPLQHTNGKLLDGIVRLAPVIPEAGLESLATALSQIQSIEIANDENLDSYISQELDRIYADHESDLKTVLDEYLSRILSSQSSHYEVRILVRKDPYLGTVDFADMSFSVSIVRLEGRWVVYRIRSL